MQIWKQGMGRYTMKTSENKMQRVKSDTKLKLIILHLRVANYDFPGYMIY